MMSSDELNTIIERIASGTQTATDVEALRVALSDRSQDLRQLGKYNVNKRSPLTSHAPPPIKNPINRLPS